ncbi:tetratricopeptide repeat protein [Rariglobus hedericola]|uniref:tetratricopeptide repeat protein n=1 Tax=Rariglobus hedericola TaxID=2597822 RepID=UPI001396B84F|nr:tetratricopeptide repeat protein [Rariglobus hedericola]
MSLHLPPPVVLRFSLALGLLATAGGLRAKDVYGNNTAWTTSDSTIRDIQIQRNRAERPGQWWDGFAAGPSPASYKEQQALRRRQEADEQRRQDEQAAWDRYERIRESTPPKPVSYREYLESRVNRNSDRAAQEELAFYLSSIGEGAAAVPHLEIVVFLKRSERAGEAAWQLFRIAAPNGAQPDAKRAAKYLKEAISLGNPDAMFTQARGWIAGDKKLGIEPDLPRGLALMEKVLHSDDPWHNTKASQILFKEYALGLHGPVEPAKAIAVARHLRTLTSNGALENWQEDAMVEFLIASPGGWAEHHKEIIAAISGNFSTIFNPDKAERLVRIHLGLDPETRPYAPIDPKKGAEALWGLARQDPARAKNYLPAILLPGPAHNAAGAFTVLEVLREKQPREVLWIRTSAELLANAYGDSFKPEDLALYLDGLEKKAETPAQLLAISQFFATGGKDVPAQPERADRILKRAVDGLRAQLERSRAESSASYELARLHVLGLGVPRDIPTAIALLKSHGSSNEPPAILYPHRVLLASIYLSGYGVGRQPREARSLLSYPARHGYVPAQAAYAEMALNWPADDPWDDGDREEAFRYAKAAAESGDTRARLTLARCYQDGFGTAADLQQALAIYADGANAGVSGALAGLAVLRFDESGPWHDAAAGFAAAQRAADLGDAEGTFVLGQCWEDGHGTKPDSARALAVYEQAARAGHWGSAVAAAKLLTVSAPPVVPDAARAIAVLEQAAANATNDQQFNLVQLLLGEAFLPEDKPRARRWARIAATNGSEEAEWLFRPGQTFGDEPGISKAN